VEGSLCESCRSFRRHRDPSERCCKIHNPQSAFAKATADKSAIRNPKSKIQNRKCASCGDKFWDGVRVLWFEQPAVVLPCEDCPVEPGKSKETGENFDDSAILPGQMELTLTMV